MILHVYVLKLSCVCARAVFFLVLCSSLHVFVTRAVFFLTSVVVIHVLGVLSVSCVESLLWLWRVFSGV